MKADTSSRPLLHTPAGVITTVSTLGIIAYLIWIFSGYFRESTDALISGVGLVLLNLLAGIFGVYIISHKGFGKTLQWAWFFITLGAWCYVIAEGLWTYYDLVLEIEPFPSPADYFYILYYPLTLIGVLILPFVFVSQQERSILWLDLGILLVFFGMVVWYFILASPVFSISQTISEYIALIYPVGDFLILAVVIAMMQRNLTRVARWVLGFFALAMVFSAVADISFALFEGQDVPYLLAYMNAPWMCAVVAQLLATSRLIASGPEILNDPPSRISPAAQMFRLALPYLAIAIGLALLAWSINTSFRADSRLSVVLYGAFGLVALVLWRQYIVSKENVRLYQKMQRIAWTDSLTSVYNRHFFNEILPREMERASRYGNQLSVLLLDIDGFKKYNDTFGHLQGDVVLKTIARIFSSQLRKSDTIARFGGDEFVVILPETNRHRAIAIADRIRGAVAAQTFNDVGLSVSIGVASYRPGLTPEQLLDEADQDMYRRKNSGKKKEQPDADKTSLEITISSFRDEL